MLHFYLQGFLSLILVRVVSGCRGTETVIAVKEEDVALSCLSPNETDPVKYRYKWTKYATDTNEPKDIYKWLSKNNQPSKWEVDGNEQKCLFLRKSQKSDEGLYTCEMWEGWDLILAKNISLKIKDCKILESVKAAPSRFAQLNCPVNITLGPQNISWAMQKGNSRFSIDSKRAKPNGTTLIFQSVTHSDGGWYRCSYMLGQTQRCFDTNLHVQEEDGFMATTALNVATKTLTSLSEPTGKKTSLTNRMEEHDSLTLVVVLVILGIIIFGALTGFFVYHKCKTQRVAQLQQRHFEGNRLSMYENVSPLMESSTRVNSLYHMPDETLVTFKK
ncbi:uncharacterized protein LOC115795047 [Archocentrus centrarchus]|uniref:uncharacterized protein LOC115795047 n=1 Tax=Archocentrus centrarchus TaxID=63155 RepID=UPI0011EA3AC7|nr:uncharacterized protein LOC115795047 [Archocentrus centrarchus]